MLASVSFVFEMAIDFPKGQPESSEISRLSDSLANLKSRPGVRMLVNSANPIPGFALLSLNNWQCFT